MYRIRIESCENADEGYTFDHETLAGAITTCVTELAEANECWSEVSDMATLLDTLVEAMRKHDAGETPIAREWDFSSPGDAYYIAFYEDSEDDDGTPCENIWKNSIAKANCGGAECCGCQYCTAEPVKIIRSPFHTKVR
jgi:hypothetical protein